MKQSVIRLHLSENERCYLVDILNEWLNDFDAFEHAPRHAETATKVIDSLESR